ncbi:CDP-glucose 4,6-dehydratase [Sphingomonas sp. MMS12-HWE2-04]|uniref:CDP-glucose 4,6-dehydratase n=1 Tax=Sphingomonas sp. MMS12-HWE2-04 TaxID=3234199 RepID=UPI00384EAFB0
MERWRGAVEDLVMPVRPDPAFWSQRRVLLLGHTGFKGSWLAVWLQMMGAKVHGLALAPPEAPNLYNAAGVAAGMSETIGDIRDPAVVDAALAASEAEVVLHLAAQPLVRQSYRDPVETYATNVMGTVHILDAVRRADHVRAVVNVTTDKCYENREWVWGYREDEAMGGYDPYSSSKGCSELVTSAWRRSYFADRGIGLASARAGNVIGGGDWAKDRIVPDLLRAFEAGNPALVRNPNAIRPWQHVLEPLSGYLVLAERLFVGDEAAASAWNFGPAEGDALPVREIADRLAASYGSGASWVTSTEPQPHEANFLKLDISKARTYLDWHPTWPIGRALEMIVAWHRGWATGEDTRHLCELQIGEYLKCKE